ncbi:hypothetical protein [Chryseobacterium sp. PMSZPI]|uniref:hypothetical protein n=1 Tax=Chryseobacterium sp. PMSZPI TaxID=1033900 RepID=UPI000C33AD44|nr:hypothetical protein [Chryseobacterium sp. PMSZPI]PKF74261.1 hypothetical protein CW752_10060 [Chryseobacterium sp. PMSZPI]
MKEDLNTLASVFNESLKTNLSHIDSEKIDIILDNRDSSEFSEAWMDAYQSIEEKEINSEIEDQIHDIRKEIFISTFRATGSSELSAYISDDFGLICSYYIQAIENKWVTSLLFNYLHHQIPQGEPMNTDKTMRALISVK